MIPKTSGQMGWQSPANIALVKYWGKHPVQLPMNPSVSFVLKESVVRIRMGYSIDPADQFNLNAFTLNGNENPAFADRIADYLRSLAGFFPFLAHARLNITSESTFPHSAGIASSAAAFSALALCICQIDAIIREEPVDDETFFRKASEMARLGSGSACRSVYDGFTLWGETTEVHGSSDEYAIRLDDQFIHKAFSSIRDSVLIVDNSTKKVSSSAGHTLMDQHPYRPARIKQAEMNLIKLLTTLRNGDIQTFGEIIENEALSLHGLMLSSNPGYILMHPHTINILNKIREFRQANQSQVYFTLDAGPNVHLIYPEKETKAVTSLIQNELAGYCQNRQWIDDALGNGPCMI